METASRLYIEVYERVGGVTSPYKYFELEMPPQLEPLAVECVGGVTSP